jgi:hypothetical protein
MTVPSFSTGVERLFALGFWSFGTLVFDFTVQPAGEAGGSI